MLEESEHKTALRLESGFLHCVAGWCGVGVFSSSSEAWDSGLDDGLAES